MFNLCNFLHHFTYAQKYSKMIKLRNQLFRCHWHCVTVPRKSMRYSQKNGKFWKNFWQNHCQIFWWIVNLCVKSVTIGDLPTSQTCYQPGLHGRNFVHLSTSVYIFIFWMVRRLNPWGGPNFGSLSIWTARRRPSSSVEVCYKQIPISLTIIDVTENCMITCMLSWFRFWSEP